MNAQDMIELNNKKRELLTSENEAAYGDMLVYLRISNVPEQQMEELLLEIFVTSHSPSSLLNVIVTFSNGGA
ncbi:hypothetical protein ACT4UM_20135, partial [Bacillus sp. SS-TM]